MFERRAHRGSSLRLLYLTAHQTCPPLETSGRAFCRGQANGRFRREDAIRQLAEEGLLSTPLPPLASVAGFWLARCEIKNVAAQGASVLGCGFLPVANAGMKVIDDHPGQPLIVRE